MMMYNDNFADCVEDSRCEALLLLWTLDVQVPLLCLTHLKADGCSLVLHLL